MRDLAIRPLTQRDYALEAFIESLYRAAEQGCTLVEFFAYFTGFDQARTAQIKALTDLATDAINCQTAIYVVPRGWPSQT